jgi:phosphopantothenoylcysteine decarboxylase/phosphopantothenate--cysteine ligase
VQCIVTAGPTFEPLDQVRRLTNFSTGKLGTELADFLARRGHRVLLLKSQLSTYHGACSAQEIRPFTTTESLKKLLASLGAQSVRAVFHASAVSDFTFGKIWTRGAHGQLTEVRSLKVGTDAGPLMAELVPTPKIISALRDWFPSALLVGWKYEVEGTRPAVLEKARAQLASCHTNVCVANGPAYGGGFGIVQPNATPLHLENAGALFNALNDRLLAADPGHR